MARKLVDSSSRAASGRVVPRMEADQTPEEDEEAAGCSEGRCYRAKLRMPCPFRLNLYAV